MTIPLDCQTPVTNLIGLSIIPILIRRLLTGPYLDSAKSERYKAAIEAAVRILGMYITTLKNPLPLIFSLASVNQTASARDRTI